jgi:glutamate-1-semialdehyde 2,1-aminomutase
MLMFYFTDEKVVDYASAQTSSIDRFGRYFWGLLEKGVYIAPSQFEAGFVSLAHSQADVDQTARVADEVLSKL